MTKWEAIELIKEYMEDSGYLYYLDEQSIQQWNDAIATLENLGE